MLLLNCHAARCGPGAVLDLPDVSATLWPAQHSARVSVDDQLRTAASLAVMLSGSVAITEWSPWTTACLASHGCSLPAAGPQLVLLYQCISCICIPHVHTHSGALSAMLLAPDSLTVPCKPVCSQPSKDV